jgi:hypothetical protein
VTHLTPEKIDDFVKLTLNKFHKHKWTDLSVGLTHYVYKRLVTDKLIQEEGGPHIEFKIKTKNTGNARVSGLYDKDNLQVEDVMAEAKTPWTKQVTGFIYDIDESFFQGDRQTIIKILKIREHDALTDMAELNEEHLWSAPVSPQDKTPMGIPFWLQKTTVDSDGGYLGGNPAGFPQGCAGVSTVDVPRWRNWAFTYRSVTPDDMVRKVKRALVFTHFKAPVAHPEVTFGPRKHEVFTTYRIQERLESLAETRNDNLGSDVARYMGQVTIGGVSVEWVPFLEENDMSDPLYGINWEVLRPYSKTGGNMRRSDPKVAARQHTVREVFFDNWMQFICTNRRACWAASRI